MGCQKGNHERYRSKREQLNLSGSFVRNDDGNSDDNVINQRFDLLNEEIESCCTCGTPFSAIFASYKKTIRTNQVKAHFAYFVHMTNIESSQST